MRFVLRVNKVFDFGHLEFSTADELVSGCNFISETQTNLSCPERKLVAILLQKSREVQEDTLCSLWSKKGGYFC
jgi:hypothetical protein